MEPTLPSQPALRYLGGESWEADVPLPGLEQSLYVLFDSPPTGPTSSYREAAGSVLKRIPALRAAGQVLIAADEALVAALSNRDPASFQVATLCLFAEPSVVAGEFYLSFHHAEDPDGSYRVEFSGFEPTAAARDQN